jgi:hypothetical protein
MKAKNSDNIIKIFVPDLNKGLSASAAPSSLPQNSTRGLTSAAPPPLPPPKGKK